MSVKQFVLSGSISKLNILIRLGLASRVYRLFSSFCGDSSRCFGTHIFSASEGGCPMMKDFNISQNSCRQFAETKAYNYHPHMPRPTNPEQSLGDCAICMEAIIVDPPIPGRSSFDLEDRCSEKESSAPLLERGTGKSDSSSSILHRTMKIFGASKTRKNYSLAPCCHLFVSCVLGDMADVLY